MKFPTGISEVVLPQVQGFTFAITGIRLADTGNVLFGIFDNDNSFIHFGFGSGLFQANNKILGSYNTVETNSISGYLSGSQLNYYINGIFNQQTVSFLKLGSFSVSASTSPVVAEVSFASLPINYSVSFSPTYKYYSALTGNISSNVSFQTLSPSFTFYNSNKTLLTGNYPSGITTTNGNTTISFMDNDRAFSEYDNVFSISIPTTFGDIGGKFTSERTGASSAPILTLSDVTGNSYYQTSEFNGYWSGSTFVYVDNVLTYNLGFDYSNTSSVGDNYPSVLKIAFQPLSPPNSGSYGSQYITGLTMVSGGLYSGTPSFSGAQYYFVTGVQNALESFLFSSGCANTLNVSFSGGASLSGASGAMILKSVRLSGIYDPGIKTYKMVSGYSGKSYGSGYQYAPTFSIATGGACYSLPDYSGVDLYQFTRATGYGAVYAQAAGLTGAVVMTGSGVSGVQVTNIGFGYGSTMPPTLRFVRVSGDTGVNNASGTFGYKVSGLYDFDSFWKASISFGGGGDGFTGVSGYNGAYSGNYPVLGAGNVQIQLICSGLDNTAPVSGVLTVILSGNGGLSLTGQRIISQSRTFNMDADALTNPPAPSYGVIPLPDLNYAFSQDQFDYQYVSDAGSKMDNIINF